LAATILLSGSRFSPAKQPAKIDGRQPGSRHREVSDEDFADFGRLRTGYGSEYAGALAPSRIVVHPIGRVGDHQMRLGPIEQIVRQSMIAEKPLLIEGRADQIHRQRLSLF